MGEGDGTDDDDMGEGDGTDDDYMGEGDGTDDDYMSEGDGTDDDDMSEGDGIGDYDSTPRTTRDDAYLSFTTKEPEGHSSAFYFLVLFFIGGVALVCLYMGIQHRKRVSTIRLAARLRGDTVVKKRNIYCN